MNVNASPVKGFCYLKIGRKFPEVLCCTWISLLNHVRWNGFSQYFRDAIWNYLLYRAMQYTNILSEVNKNKKKCIANLSFSVKCYTSFPCWTVYQLIYSLPVVRCFGDSEEIVRYQMDKDGAKLLDIIYTLSISGVVSGSDS